MRGRNHLSPCDYTHSAFKVVSSGKAPNKYAITFANCDYLDYFERAARFVKGMEIQRVALSMVCPGIDM